MRSLLVAVVGAGRMGLRHARALESLGIAVVGFDSSSLALAALEAQGFNVVRQLDDALVIASHVIVATPNHEHNNVALAALAARLPTLIEKPIALDLAEASQLVSSFGAAEVPLFVAHSERFHPAVTQLRASLGKEDVIEARFVRIGPSQTAQLSPMLTHAIHDFDLARWLLGGSLRLTTVKKLNDVEVATLLGEQGARVSVVSGMRRSTHRTIEVRTPTRLITVDLVTSTITTNGHAHRLSFPPAFGLEAQARAFAIFSSELATGTDGLVALALATEASTLAHDLRVTRPTYRGFHG